MADNDSCSRFADAVLQLRFISIIAKLGFEAASRD
jgi:hypothetical protein